MSIPNDKQLYQKAKNMADEIYKKPSAYKSGYIVKTYKELYLKKYGNSNAYQNSNDKSLNQGLNRWFKEDWRNQRGEIGYKQEGDIYRPTKRVSKDTPKTLSELSKTDIRKAMTEKKKTGRVKKF